MFYETLKSKVIWHLDFFLISFWFWCSLLYVYPGDLGSIPGRVIPKTFKMVLDTSLLNTRQYEVCIKGKVEQFWERSSALPLLLGVVAIEKGAFWLPSTTVTNFTLLTVCINQI